MEYLTIYGEYNSHPFSLKEASKLLELPTRTLRYDVHKMKKNLALQTLERGLYRAVEPEKWIGITMALQKFPDLLSFFQWISSKLSNIESIMLYGSRIRGDYRKDSDYDILIVTDGKSIFSEDEVEALRKSGYEITVSYESDLRKDVREHPVSIVPILREAWPLFNKHIRELLLRSYKEKNLLRDLEEIMECVVESKYVVHPNDNLKRSLVFLAVSRSRQLYLIEVLIGDKEFSTQRWLDRIKENWKLEPREVQRLYKLYKEIEKGGKPSIESVTEEQLKKITEGNTTYVKTLIEKWGE